MRAAGTEELMNLQSDPNTWAVAKFGIGQPVLRSEDPTLVRGEGRFTDDVNVPGQVYAAIVRSPPKSRSRKRTPMRAKSVSSRTCVLSPKPMRRGVG